LSVAETETLKATLMNDPIKVQKALDAALAAEPAYRPARALRAARLVLDRETARAADELTGLIARLETGGMVVGAFEQTMFDEQTLQLEPGDLLVAYSDGLTEARNTEGDEFGEGRLLACVCANTDLAPTELLECVFDAVHEFSAGTAQGDDLTLLVLQFAGA
jgi:sigma-B regulation protein RsbU (phosphoserine phosphatase)